MVQGIAKGTYSLSVTGVGDHNPTIPKVHQLQDSVVITTGAEQQAMRLGTPFYRLAPDGSQVLVTFDAERTIPGVLRYSKRV